PNCPDPQQTFRIVPKDEFYRKWFEKMDDIIIRRPALSVTPEITPDGRQVVASQKRVKLAFSNGREAFTLEEFQEGLRQRQASWTPQGNAGKPLQRQASLAPKETQGLHTSELFDLRLASLEGEDDSHNARWEKGVKV